MGPVYLKHAHRRVTDDEWEEEFGGEPMALEIGCFLGWESGVVDGAMEWDARTERRLHFGVVVERLPGVVREMRRVARDRVMRE